jgi:RNA polymerase sigma factor (sigma-70 family)
MLTFHDLYTLYAGDVYRFAFWLTGNSEDAQDITSETFVRAWTSKETLKLTTVKSYLLTIARNCFLHGKRDTKPQTKLDANIPDPRVGPDHRIEVQSELKALTHALQQLSDIDRIVLLMRAQEGLPYEDIAQSVQLSVSAVKVKVHRARLKLKLIHTSWEG